MSTERIIEQIEGELRSEFDGVSLEFSRQLFQNHVELWVYVLSIADYKSVKQKCQELARERQLDDQLPEIWIIVKTWSGPWPGGNSEIEIRRFEELERKRDEVRRKLSLANAAK